MYIQNIWLKSLKISIWISIYLCNDAGYQIKIEIHGIQFETYHSWRWTLLLDSMFGIFSKTLFALPKMQSLFATAIYNISMKHPVFFRNLGKSSPLNEIRGWVCKTKNHYSFVFKKQYHFCKQHTIKWKEEKKWFHKSLLRLRCARFWSFVRWISQ